MTLVIGAPNAAKLLDKSVQLSDKAGNPASIASVAQLFSKSDGTDVCLYVINSAGDVHKLSRPDEALAYLALQYYTKVAFTFTATPTFDVTPGLASPVRGTTVLTANVTALNYSNVPAHPGYHEWHVKQDATGTRTITKHASVLDPDGLLATLDTTANMNSVIVADFVDGTAVITRVQKLGVIT